MRVDLNLNGKSWAKKPREIFRREVVASIPSERAETPDGFHPRAPRGTMATQTRVRHGLARIEGIVSIGYYFRAARNRACAGEEADTVKRTVQTYVRTFVSGPYLAASWCLYHTGT